MTSPVVLITGSSSGIGRSLCWAFHQRGFRVVATAREVAAIADLQAAGMLTLTLDVTVSAHIHHVVDTVRQQEKRLDILVNNAGYGLFGPLLDLSPTAIAQQFSTNVFAPLQMVQAAAPLMKAQGSGLILNIGSISGVMTSPFAGAYCASKAALHSLSDALRIELAPFGIHVVTVQPGAIASNFGQNAQQSTALTSLEESWYQPIAHQIQRRATFSQQDATSADDFAEQLARQVTQPSPPPEIRIGKKSLQFLLLKRLLPTRLLDKVLARRFGLISQNLFSKNMS